MARKCSAAAGSTSFDCAKQAAGPGRVNVDIGSARFAEATFNEAIYLSTIDNIAEPVDDHVVGTVDADRHQPIAHDFRNLVIAVISNAAHGMDKNRAGRPINSARAGKVIRPEQHLMTRPRFSKTISARVTVMIGNFTPRSIAAVIYPGRPETIGNARIDGYASKCGHDTSSRGVDPLEI
jgi:hypothetical protein